MNELWRLRRNGRVWAATAVVGLATVVTVAVIAGSIVFSGDSPGPRDDTAAPAVQQNAFGRQYDGPGCREGEPGVPLVLLARLRAGHTLTELPGSVRALDGAEENLVVYWPGYNPIPRSDLTDIPTHPALQSVGWLRPNTVDPSLRSCSYKLEDNPAAADIGRRAAAFMVEQGLLTQDQIEGPGTTFQLAEDPTNTEHLLFSVVLANSVATGPAGAPPSTSGLTPYTAIIDRSSGTVLGAGRAHWYNLSCSLASPGLSGSITCSPAESRESCGRMPRQPLIDCM